MIASSPETTVWQGGMSKRQNTSANDRVRLAKKKDSEIGVDKSQLLKALREANKAEGVECPDLRKYLRMGGFEAFSDSAVVERFSEFLTRLAEKAADKIPEIVKQPGFIHFVNASASKGSKELAVALTNYLKADAGDKAEIWAAQVAPHFMNDNGLGYRSSTTGKLADTDLGNLLQVARSEGLGEADINKQIDTTRDKIEKGEHVSGLHETVYVKHIEQLLQNVAAVNEGNGDLVRGEEILVPALRVDSTILAKINKEGEELMSNNETIDWYQFLREVHIAAMENDGDKKLGHVVSTGISKGLRILRAKAEVAEEAGNKEAAEHFKQQAKNLVKVLLDASGGLDSNYRKMIQRGLKSSLLMGKDIKDISAAGALDAQSEKSLKAVIGGLENSKDAKTTKLLGMVVSSKLQTVNPDDLNLCADADRKSINNSSLTEGEGALIPNQEKYERAAEKSLEVIYQGLHHELFDVEGTNIGNIKKAKTDLRAALKDFKRTKDSIPGNLGQQNTAQIEKIKDLFDKQLTDALTSGGVIKNLTTKEAETILKDLVTELLSNNSKLTEKDRNAVTKLYSADISRVAQALEAVRDQGTPGSSALNTAPAGLSNKDKFSALVDKITKVKEVTIDNQGNIKLNGLKEFAQDEEEDKSIVISKMYDTLAPLGTGSFAKFFDRIYRDPKEEDFLTNVTAKDIQSFVKNNDKLKRELIRQATNGAKSIDEITDDPFSAGSTAYMIFGDHSETKKDKTLANRAALAGLLELANKAGIDSNDALAKDLARLLGDKSLKTLSGKEEKNEALEEIVERIRGFYSEDLVVKPASVNVQEVKMKFVDSSLVNNLTLGIYNRASIFLPRSIFLDKAVRKVQRDINRTVGGRLAANMNLFMSGANLGQAKTSLNKIEDTIEKAIGADVVDTDELLDKVKEELGADSTEYKTFENMLYGYSDDPFANPRAEIDGENVTNKLRELMDICYFTAMSLVSKQDGSSLPETRQETKSKKGSSEAPKEEAELATAGASNN